MSILPAISLRLSFFLLSQLNILQIEYTSNPVHLIIFGISPQYISHSFPQTQIHHMKLTYFPFQIQVPNNFSKVMQSSSEF